MTHSWHIGPFTPTQGEILSELPDVRFPCPIVGTDVAWAAKDVFNPGADDVPRV